MRSSFQKFCRLARLFMLAKYGTAGVTSETYVFAKQLRLIHFKPPNERGKSVRLFLGLLEADVLCTNFFKIYLYVYCQSRRILK